MLESFKKFNITVRNQIYGLIFHSTILKNMRKIKLFSILKIFNEKRYSTHWSEILCNKNRKVELEVAICFCFYDAR